MEYELPKGWMSASIGTFADVLGGSTPSRKESRYFGGDIVWLTPTEIPKETVSVISDSKEKLTEDGYKESGVRWIPAGSVLLTSRASIGYVAIAGVKLTTNQGFASFVLPDEIDPRYFGWWLRLQKTNLEDLAKGTTFKEISKTELKEVMAPLAPLNEQHRIVAAIEQQFSRLDAAVTSLRHARAKLKRQRAAILRAAVEGTLTADWRAQHSVSETADQLLQRILHERRAKWEAEQLAKMQARGVAPKDDKWKEAYKEPESPDTTNLPELPEGWIWARAEQLCEFITKGTTPTAEKLYRETGEVPFIKVYNLTDRGLLDFSISPTFVSEQTHSRDLARSKVFPGDVLMNIVGPPLGKVSIVSNLYPEWNINQAIAFFRPLSDY